MNSGIIINLSNLLPELTLAITIIILTIAVTFLKGKHKIPFYILLIGLAAAFVYSILGIYIQPQLLFNNLLVTDPFSIYNKILIALSILVISISLFNKTNSPQEYILILALTLGCLLSVSSSNLIMMFVSLETISISCCILFSPERKTAIKYFIYSITFSGIMLYGISILYGICGSMDYYEISRFLSVNPYNALTLLISVLLITAGLAFKLLLFPFNFIFPFLSEKLPVRNLSLLSVPAVITGISVTARLFLTVFHDTNSFITDNNSYRLISGVKWDLLLSIISVLSILAGSFIILWQENIKKIAAFLIIIQSGNLLTGLISSSPDGTSSMLMYLFIYTVNTLGLLFCTHLITGKLNANNINELKGLGRSSPFLFIAFLIFIISSIGLPFTSGFTAKILIYSSLIEKGYIWLVFIAAMSSLLPIYFFYKLMYSIFSASNRPTTINLEPGYKIILLLLLIPAILVGIYFTPLLDFAKYGSHIYGI